MNMEDLAARAAALRRGRTVLCVAAAGALLGLLGALTGKPVLSVIGWVAAVVGGLGGLSDSARALGTAAPVKYAAMLGAMVPGLNLPLLAGFAWHSQRGLAGLDEALRAQTARERRARRAAESPARAGTPAPQAPGVAPARAAAGAAAPAARRADVRSAVACVKAAMEGAGADTWLEVGLPRSAGLPAMSRGSQPLARRCGGHFVVCYLVDEGNEFRYVNHDDLEAARLLPDDLHTIGLHNLSALAAGKPGLRTGREGATHALLMGGHFEASLVLLDDLWDGPLAAMAPHGAVVALPARDICAFCDVRSAEGVAQLQQLAQRVTDNGDHPITPRLFQRIGGRWSPWAG